MLRSLLSGAADADRCQLFPRRNPPRARPSPAHALPGHELSGTNYRRWAAAVCAAEAKHAVDDFWAIVYRLGLSALFDRDDGFGGHEAPFRFAHETHAFAALGWLSHLQAHESDRRGPWAAVRWNTWDAGQRLEWFARRRHLWSGFVRQVERYRLARRQLGSEPLGDREHSQSVRFRTVTSPT